MSLHKAAVAALPPRARLDYFTELDRARHHRRRRVYCPDDWFWTCAACGDTFEDGEEAVVIPVGEIDGELTYCPVCIAMAGEAAQVRR